MKPSLLERLVDPLGRAPLVLETADPGAADVETGALRAADGCVYPILNGIPRMVLTSDEGQGQTSDAFGFKWKRRDTYDSPAAREVFARWCVEKYGFESFDAWVAFFQSREVVVDVGCGSGFTSSLWLQAPRWDSRTMWIGMDISAAIDVARERLADVANVHFVQADALQLPLRDGSVDTILSEGVLHHTPSTRAALLSAARVLAPGGEIHFYVYRRKAPVREFTDDYVREAIAGLSDEDAWDAMRPLTRLARTLHEQAGTVDVEDVPVLGIAAGRMPVQRLIYWNFAKLFWNPDLSFEENVHINFDWYRPRYSHRQSESEIRSWCEEAGLQIAWWHEQESGFTVRAVRSARGRTTA